MNNKTIESAVRSLQFEIWKDRDLIFPAGVPPLQAMFQPYIAARVLGMEYEFRDHLGFLGHGRQRQETAGLLDRRRGLIAVSTRFSIEAQRFTGAHEIGHAVLHEGEVLHRDRPVSASEIFVRPQVEREADYFAACFLAPKKLVEEQFTRRFGRAPLRLSDTVAFHLVGEAGMHDLLLASASSLDFAAAVAGARSFNGAHFQSLADSFGLSSKAMALRLHELELVQT